MADVSLIEFRDYVQGRYDWTVAQIRSLQEKLPPSHPFLLTCEQHIRNSSIMMRSLDKKIKKVGPTSEPDDDFKRDMALYMTKDFNVRNQIVGKIAHG